MTARDLRKAKLAGRMVEYLTIHRHQIEHAPLTGAPVAYPQGPIDINSFADYCEEAFATPTTVENLSNV